MGMADLSISTALGKRKYFHGTHQKLQYLILKKMVKENGLIIVVIYSDLC